MRMDGSALEDRGIFHGDILIVDRSVSPKPGLPVVFQYEGQFRCREIVKGKDGVRIMLTADWEVPVDPDMEIFGVVIAVVRKL